MANETKTEKRKLLTFFDPKLLQMLIPVFIAVGSGFIAHDRSISSLETEVQNHKENIKKLMAENDAVDERVQTLRTEVSSLVLRVSVLEVSTEITRSINDELSSIITKLEQRDTFNTSLLQELRERVRALEIQVDRLSR